jgi:hypothetical protein
MWHFRCELKANWTHVVVVAVVDICLAVILKTRKEIGPSLVFVDSMGDLWRFESVRPVNLSVDLRLVLGLNVWRGDSVRKHDQEV